jgi:Protein kinase domain/Type II secretion system (T2SS), protein E, N-terminal domain
MEPWDKNSFVCAAQRPAFVTRCAARSVADFLLKTRLTRTRGLWDCFVAQQGAQEPVILKQIVEPWKLNPGSTSRLFDALAKGIGQPHLIPLKGFGTSDNGAVILEAGVAAESVRRLMRSLAAQGQAVAPNEGLSLVALAAKQLAQLHESKIIHGDLNPSGLFVSRSGALLFANAGVAAALSASQSSVQPLAAPARSEESYLSPEQLVHHPTAASDVFLLGLLLYEFCSGQMLFQNDALVQCQRFTGVNRNGLPKIPEPWISLIVSMLSPDERDRPTAQEVAFIANKGCTDFDWSDAAPHVGTLFQRGFAKHSDFDSKAMPRTIQVELIWPLPPTETEFRPVTPAAGSEKIPAPAPSIGSILGKISTKKMSTTELKAALAETVPHEAKGPELTLDEQVFELLVKKKGLPPARVNEAKQHATLYQLTELESLVAKGWYGEDEVVTGYGEVTRMPVLLAAKLLEMPVDSAAVARFPLELSRSYGAVPLALKNKSQLMLAMQNPLSTTDLTFLRETLALSIVAIRAGPAAIRTARQRIYEIDDHDLSDLIEPSPSQPRPSISPRQSPPASAKTPADVLMASGQVPLECVEALAFALGAQGQMAIALATVFEKFLKALQTEEDEAPVALWLVMTSNLVEGQSVSEKPSSQMLKRVSGARFESLESVLAPALEWPQVNASHEAGLALGLTMALHRHFNGAAPSPALVNAFVLQHPQWTAQLQTLAQCFYAAK